MTLALAADIAAPLALLRSSDLAATVLVLALLPMLLGGALYLSGRSFYRSQLEHAGPTTPTPVAPSLVRYLAPALACTGVLAAVGLVLATLGQTA